MFKCGGTYLHRLSVSALSVAIVLMMLVCVCSPDSFSSISINGVQLQNKLCGNIAGSSGDTSAPSGDDDIRSSIMQYTSSTVFAGITTSRYRQKLAHRSAQVNLENLFLSSAPSDPSSDIMHTLFADGSPVTDFTTQTYLKTTRKIE